MKVKIAAEVFRKLGWVQKQHKWVRESYEPSGSIEDLRDQLREALKVSGYFPEVGNNYYAWIRNIFPDESYMLVEYANKNYKVPYSGNADSGYALGKPEEVEVKVTTTVEPKAQETEQPHGQHGCICPECGATTTVAVDVKCNTQKCPDCGTQMRGSGQGERRESKTQESGKSRPRPRRYKEPKFEWLRDLVLAGGSEGAAALIRGADFSLTGVESEERFALRVIEDERHDPDNNNYHIVIATAGRNVGKRRWYLNEAFDNLPETGFYDGLQMHKDHGSKEGEPLAVRSVETLTAVVRESWRMTSTEAADGVARYDAVVHVFANAGPFRESMQDPLFRQAVFVSHVADCSGYEAYEAASNRKTTWQCIAKIDRALGVDWVTRPGARGRVAEADAVSTQTTEDDVEIKDITLAQLRAENPALVTEIEGAVVGPLQKQLDELKTANESAATVQRKERITAAVNEAVKDKVYGIPETAHESIVQRVVGNVVTLKVEETEDDKLAAVVKTAMLAEANVVATLQGRPEVTLESGAPPPASKTDKRTAAQALADRL